MTTDTLPTTKTLKDLGWHLRAADLEHDKSGDGWVQENLDAGLKTRVYESAADAAPAARRLERLRHDPSADLRMCKDCLFTYDINDPSEASEHAEHWHSLGRGQEVEAAESHPAQDPWAHEEEIKGRIVGFLGEQGVEVDGTGTTPLGASYLAAGHELVVIGCGQHSQGLRGHILDAMRLRVSPLRTACVVACCTNDPAEYESDEKVYDVPVLTFEQFEQRHTPALSDIIIQQLTECDTLPEFQRLVRDYALEKAMDFETDERFDGPELGRVYDAIDASAVRVGLRRREEDGLADEDAHVVGGFNVEEARAELEQTVASDAVSEEEAAASGGATQNISGGEPVPATPAVPPSLLPNAESSEGASAGGAQRRPQMHPRRIQRHPLLLMRAGGLNEEHVQELQDVLKAGGRFKDPNVVFYDKELDTYWNAEGNHRHEAALRQDALLDVDIRYGTLEDAIEFAAGSNAEHGLKRNDNDRRLAVVTLLSNPKHFGLSDGLVAKTAHVTPQFVGLVRQHLPKILPSLDGDAKEIGARVGAPAGLVQVVQNLLPNTFTALAHNVANDTGERLGADGRVYNVKASAQAAPAEDVAALPFDEEPAATPSESAEAVEVEEVTPHAEPDEEEEPEAEPAEQVSKHYRLAGHLKPLPQGAPTDDLLASGFTMFDINEARKSRLIERHENGRCFYAWTTADIVEALRDGPLTRGKLEELGCQYYALVRALDEKAVEQPTPGHFSLPSARPAQSPQPKPDAGFDAIMKGDGWELKAEGARFYAVNERLKLGTILFDKAQDAVDDAVRQQDAHHEKKRAAAAATSTRADTERSRREPARASVEEMLKGRKGLVTLSWIPGVKGDTQVAVTVDGDVSGALRELVPERELGLSPKLMGLIEQQIKAAGTGAKKEVAAEAPPAARATKKAATKKGSTKPPAKKAASKSAAKKTASKSGSKGSSKSAAKSGSKSSKSTKGRTK